MKNNCYIDNLFLFIHRFFVNIVFQMLFLLVLNFEFDKISALVYTYRSDTK